jgi:homoserine acetyltransferase
MTWAPAFRVATTKPEDVDTFIADTEKLLLKYNAWNWEWQLRAIKTQNILKTFGDSPEKAASAIKAGTLIITSAQDYCVYSGPSKSFAPLIKAKTFELTGDCGHFSFICEQDKLASNVGEFLADNIAPSEVKAGK